MSTGLPPAGHGECALRPTCGWFPRTDSPRCHSLEKRKERREAAAAAAAASQASPLSTSQDVMTLRYGSQRMRSPVAVGPSSEDHTNDTRRSETPYLRALQVRLSEAEQAELETRDRAPSSIARRPAAENHARDVPDAAIAPPVKPFAGPHPHMTTHPAPSATRHVSCDTPMWAASCRQWHTDVGLKHETEHPLLEMVCTFSSWLVSFSPINMCPPSFNALHSPGPPAISLSNMGHHSFPSDLFALPSCPQGWSTNDECARVAEAEPRSWYCGTSCSHAHGDEYTRIEMPPCGYSSYSLHICRLTERRLGRAALS
ncbi:hypothetical protein BKA56DRAFT_271933 [Ilyonectria sp. MPI-CAGE-AT-0026]|nr:hypothetical protein BKA56DRAFT_271933 [Ilyonectria sp. MPI-CAGE-AT-0026]